MAEAPCAPLPTGGFESNFVDSIPDSLTCPVCLLPFCDPHLLDCCGIKICATCVGRIDAAGQPCPQCRLRFVHIPDKSTSRQVLGLKVHCSRKQDGCEWVGELRHLDIHERDQCGLVLVNCSQCGEGVPRCHLAEHEHEECLQRPVTVVLESFMRKMESKLTLEREHHEREITAVRDECKKQMEQQQKEYEAKLNQLEQALQKLTQQGAEQVAKLKKEVEEEIVPQCALVKEMRGIIVLNYNNKLDPSCCIHEVLCGGQ